MHIQTEYRLIRYEFELWFELECHIESDSKRANTYGNSPRKGILNY